MKVMSLNCEGTKHLAKFVPFIEAEQPDVVCFQEMFKSTLLKLEEALQMKGYFTVLSTVTAPNPHLPVEGAVGIAILTKLPVIAEGDEYYVGRRDQIPDFFQDENPNSLNRAVRWVTVEYEGYHYRVATTHFTWSPGGMTTDEQRRHAQKLLQLCEQFPDLILCGDFNAPRGQEIFSLLSERYHDNIPVEYTTSLDPILHKAGPLSLMVDGFFTTPQYQTKNVRVVSGLSDHQAVIGEVTKVV